MDGWGVEVGKEVDEGFWGDLGEVVKEVKGERYMVGEIWDD